MGMEPENLDIEPINEDQRKAIRQNIEVISVDDLKASSSIPATHAIMPPQTMAWRAFIVPRLTKECGTQRIEVWDHSLLGRSR